MENCEYPELLPLRIRKADDRVIEVACGPGPTGWTWDAQQLRAAALALVSLATRLDEPAASPARCCWHRDATRCPADAAVTRFVRRFDGELHPARMCAAHAFIDDDPGWPLAAVYATTDMQEAMLWAWGEKPAPPGMLLALPVKPPRG